MKQFCLFLLKLLSLSFALNESEASDLSTASGDCENWPEQHKDVRECCSIPSHEHYDCQRYCQSVCVLEDKGTDYACFLDCYLNQTGLLKNGNIDKDVLKNLFAGHYSTLEWSDVIKLAADACELASSGSLGEKILKYFSCLNDRILENCVEFHETNECDSVQLRFETCRGKKPNCASWPENIITPEECCEKPTINELYVECEAECKRKEIFSFKRMECAQNCFWIYDGILTSDGIIDFNTVTNLLIENAASQLIDNSGQWNKSIEFAIEKCEKIIKGKFGHRSTFHYC